MELPMTPPSIPLLGSMLALTLLTSSAPPPLDLDIGVPPGAPTTWGQRYPAITPARAPLFPTTPRPKKRQGGTAAVATPRKLDLDSQSSLGIVRILTWDIANELAWPKHAPKTQGPVTGPRNDRLPLPGIDHALYWSSLAPLLRLMFHPQQVSKAETVAHLIEIGMPVLTRDRQRQLREKPCGRSATWSVHASKAAPGFCQRSRLHPARG